MAHVTFIHGIGNKPAAERLLMDWRAALGLTTATTTGLVYWADLLYDKPLAEKAATDTNDEDQLLESAGAPSEDPFPTEPYALPARTAPGGKTMRRLADRLGYEEADDVLLEGFPLPVSWKRKLIQTLLRDVDAYLFNREVSPRPEERHHVQDEIRRRVRVALAQAPKGPHLLIGHSMGSVIAYDCLLRDPACPSVDALLTIGSPLGLEEIHTELVPGWTADDGFPRAHLRGGWTNIFDGLDPIAAFAPLLAEHFREDGVPRVVDAEVDNKGVWTHDALKYLSQPVVRYVVRRSLGG